MKMTEINEAVWTEKVERNETFAVFLYTPLCGTCQLGAQMLDVIMAIDPNQSIYQINVSYMKELQITYNVESVPCFMLFENGQLAKKIYAMQSVSNLYELTAPLRKK